MRLRRIACCAALLLGLTQTIAAAGACDGADCRTAAKPRPLYKPLELNKFMRTSIPKPAARAVKKQGGGDGDATLAGRLRPAPPRAAAGPEPIPVEAAAAFASLPSAQVRVVASDELNAIDRAADAAPAGTNGAEPLAEDAVQLVDAAEYNDIDRKGDDIQPAPFAGAPSNLDAPAHSDQASLSWIERVWAMLRSAVLALAVALRPLIG